jgi:xanthine dehydrogenase accessory factor
MKAFRRLIEAIEAEGSAALVTLARVEGSSPREAGVRMVVRPSGGFHGTVGGGALEFAALEAANEALRRGRGPAWRRSLALGLSLANAAVGALNGESRRSIRATSMIFQLWLSRRVAP